jgi:putative phosphoribosyl transferase
MLKMNARILLIAAGVSGAAALILFVLRFISRFQIKFKDRNSAAFILAEVLRNRLASTSGATRDEIIVLGIARGGAVIGDIVARRLGAHFNIVNVIKIGKPENKENALGAIAEDNTMYLDRNMINKFEISQEYIHNEISDAKSELLRRLMTYRGTADQVDFLVSGRTVILVDDGAATGSTLIAASRSLKRARPKRLIVATPVAPRETLKLLTPEADLIEVISTPQLEEFTTVGGYYRDFHPVTDKNVIEIMRNRNYLAT